MNIVPFRERFNLIHNNVFEGFCDQIPEFHMRKHVVVLCDVENVLDFLIDDAIEVVISETLHDNKNT